MLEQTRGAVSVFTRTLAALAMIALGRLASPGACALAALAESSASAPTDRISGVTRTYQPGVTVSVDQIMAQEPFRPQVLWSEPPLFGSSGSASSSEFVGEPPDLPQTVGTSFKAVDYSESFWIPPETAGDVGPTQILVHVNGRIKVFDKSGNVGALNTTSASFWAALTAIPAVGPEVRYDRLSGRWFVFAVTQEQLDNTLLIAVSSGPSITGAASFTFYAMPFAPEGSFNDSWYDLGIGIDANAVYVGTNQYFFSSLAISQAWVIRKSSITGGGPLVATSFPYISQDPEGGPQAARGVDNDDPGWPEGYFIGTDSYYFPGGGLRLVRIYDPGGIPTSSAPITLAETDAGILSQSVLGTTTNLDASYRRLHAATMHKNKLTGVTSLWTSQSLETDMTCTAADSGDARRLAARWYEIGDLTTAPSIMQEGTLCTTAFGNGVTNTERGFLYPTVAATGQGHMALGSSFASRTEYAGVAAAGRLRTDPASGTRPETVVLAGLGSYSKLNAQNRNVWGDYSFTSVDPTDDQTVWTFQEYADTSGNWAVRVVQLKAPPPPNLAGASNTLCIGATAIPVTIFGTDACAAPVCTNGLCTGGGVCPEFFDPGPDPGGPGFAKHITASANGGVTVNGASIVAPADPASQRVLSVALSLNTTAATAGTRIVTITNPDGQAKSLGLLTVMSNRLPTSIAGGPYTICQGGSVMLVGTASTDPDGPCGDSLVAYAWDLNNDGTFDVTGSTPSVTASQLTALGVGVGVNTIKLKVTDSHNGTNTANGTLTILAEGTACTDGNACTQIDICQSGACVGANPVACAASDQCHDAGICDPATGACSNPSKFDGASCSDANACTQTDACQAGTCLGSNPVVCSASDQCHAVGTCDSGTGICSNPPRPDGSICNDANAETCGDVCTSAICAGHDAAKPDTIDDSLMLAKPGSGPDLFWTDVPGPYGVYRGLKGPGPWSYNQACVGVVSGTSTFAFGTPPAGSFYYYLVSRYNECRESELGTDSHAGPIPNAAPCPGPP